MIVLLDKLFHVGVKRVWVAVVKDQTTDTVTADLYQRLVDGVPVGLLEKDHVFKIKGRGKDCPFTFQINDKSDD